MAVTRRQVLGYGAALLATAVLPPRLQSTAASSGTLRIAFLHLAPVPADITSNRRLVETALTTAAGLRATWIITPELCIPGYTFTDQIGTDWILPQPDPWMTQVCHMAARLNVTVFLSHPERELATGKLFNSLFVIGSDGSLLGRHRKIHTLKVGSEAWSSPGSEAVAIAIPPIGKVGLLICADMSSLDLCQRLKSQGVQLLVSAAAWGPGLHGPNGEWERCAKETAIPVLVCNRTGPDRTLDFTAAETAVVKDGRRLVSFSSKRSAVVTVDWDLEAQTLATPAYQSIYL